MSVRERRNRADSQGKTAEQLHRNRCGVCMEPIRRGEETREVARGSGRAHVICPAWSAIPGQVPLPGMSS